VFLDGGAIPRMAAHPIAVESRNNVVGSIGPKLSYPLGPRVTGEANRIGRQIKDRLDVGGLFDLLDLVGIALPKRWVQIHRGFNQLVVYPPVQMHRPPHRLGAGYGGLGTRSGLIFRRGLLMAAVLRRLAATLFDLGHPSAPIMV